MRKRRRASTGAERRVSIDLRVSPREKVSEKKGEKKDRKARHARIRWKRSGWSWIPRCDNLPFPGSGNDEGMRAVLPWGWPGVSGEDWRLCAWVVHYDSVDSPIRCAAFTTERSCQSVWKVRPVANCDLSRGKTRWSRLTAREKGGAWRSVQGANVFGTFAIHIAIRASRGLGDEMQKCLNLFNFTHKEILIESVALKREFYKRQKFAGLENTLLSERYFILK